MDPIGCCSLPSAATNINKRLMIENRKIASLTPIGCCWNSRHRNKKTEPGAVATGSASLTYWLGCGSQKEVSILPNQTRGGLLRYDVDVLVKSHPGRGALCNRCS